MSRPLRVLLCLALLGLSWPAAAQEHAVDLRLAPAGTVVAPQAVKLAALSGGLGLAPLTPSRSLSLPSLLMQGAVPSASLRSAALSSTALTPLATAPRGLSAAPASASPEAAPEAASALAAQALDAGNASGPPAARAETKGRSSLAEASLAVADSGAAFDGAAAGKGSALAAPAAVLGAAAIPLGAAHLASSHGPHLLSTLHSAAPQLGAFGYDVANVLSVAFPLPEAYAALRRGHAFGFPVVRAALGASGTLALGMINAVVLGKPLWGVMHVFIGLGIMAPYVIGRFLEKRGAVAPYVAPKWEVKPSFVRRAGHRLRWDKALWVTAGVGLVMLALSSAIYIGSAAVVPGLLAAHFSSAVVADILLWIQLAKGALFVAVFAPDVAALIKGKPTHGFSFWFTAIYLASVAAFTLWGFSSAALSPAGPIRDQYLVHGLRNLLETVASALSLLAIRRAARGR